MRHSTTSDRASGDRPGDRPLPRAGTALVAALAALAAGALLAFGLWAGFSPADPGSAAGVDQGRGAPVSGTDDLNGGTASAAPDGGHQSAVLQPKMGDCLLINRGSRDGGVVVVPCAEAHHMEVVGLVDPAAVISGEPSQAEWAALLEAHCESLLQAHLGSVWDPQGRFRLRLAAPGPSEWLQGDHTGECLVIIRSGPDDPAEMPLFRGPLRDLDQATRYPQGLCLAQGLVLGAPPTPVACESPHHFQVLESLDLSIRFPHAPDDAQWASLDQECTGQIHTRFGGSANGASGHPLVGSTIRIPVRSWLAGSRHSGCLVSELDAATGHLLERTSSLVG